MQLINSCTFAFHLITFQEIDIQILETHVCLLFNLFAQLVPRAKLISFVHSFDHLFIPFPCLVSRSLLFTRVCVTPRSCHLVGKPRRLSTDRYDGRAHSPGGINIYPG